MPRKKPPANETPAAAFKRIQEPRLNDAVHAIKLLKKGANPKSYKWTPDQVKVISTALRSAVSEVEQAFANPEAAAKVEGISL